MTTRSRPPGQAEATGSLLLTASEALARECRERANLEHVRSGKSAWEVPQIQSFSSWLIESWTRTWPDEQLLSPAQEMAVWRDIIERDPVGEALLSSAAAAAEARRTDDLLNRFAPDMRDFPARTEEERAFVRWRGEFEERKRNHRWLSQPEVPLALARLLEQGRVPVPRSVQLAGFTGPMSACDQRVLDALIAQGCEVQRLERPATNAQIDRRVVDDDVAQFRDIALDIRRQLPQLVDGRPPRILIALPDPESRRDLLEACLRELVAPWVTAGEGDVPWRWEQGERLANHAVVDAMLTVVELQAEGNDASLIGRLLLSPIIWSEPERVLLASLDWRFRRLSWAKIGLRAVAKRLLESGQEGLADRFSRLSAELQTQSPRQLPSLWASHFRNGLDAVGWPGSEPLDSEGFQAVRSATSLLDQLGTLDEQLGKIPRFSACAWLAELASRARFSPRVEHAQPIMIADLESASRLSADRLYVADASADVIPGPARPAAFMPVGLQREIGIPIASADQVLAQARESTEQLLTFCADWVRVTVPRIDSRGAELRPSVLFGGADCGGWNAVSSEATSGNAIEQFLDEFAGPSWPESDPVPPIPDAELAAMRVGSGLFKAWFESPFFAFCQYRLGIEPLPEAGVGLEARDQGVLVHAVLESFWKSIRDSRRLSQLDDETLMKEVSRHVETCADEILPAQHFGEELRKLEIARTLDLVRQWLSYEKGRVDDFSVEQCEVVAEPRVAGLALRLVLDRVDRIQTPSGDRWLVIDYKTGRNLDKRGWKSEVLSEPQLPLYASHAAQEVPGLEQVDGICFAHVKDGHPDLIAQTNWRKKLTDEALKDSSAEWAESLSQWQAAMEQATRGFIEGIAWLNPKLSGRSNYAHLLNLVSEHAAAEESDAHAD